MLILSKKPHPDELRAPARVVELMRGHACQVELPNGHRAVGQNRTHIFAVGDQVTIAFHPYDLARGWIVARDGLPTAVPPGIVKPDDKPH